MLIPCNHDRPDLSTRGEEIGQTDCAAGRAVRLMSHNSSRPTLRFWQLEEADGGVRTDPHQCLLESVANCPTLPLLWILC